MLDETGLAVLLLVLLSGVVVLPVPEKTGVVPTVDAAGVIGMVNDVLPPTGNELELLQFTVCPVTVQPKPLLVKLAGALTPVGNVVVKPMGPAAGAVPTLLMLTGRLEI